MIQAWGINDKGTDLLGGGRGIGDGHPELRGRFLARHQQELGEDWFLQAQLVGLSDKNFLEEYYWNTFATDINQETFIYLKNQHDNWAWTTTYEQRIRNWVNETERLPEVRGYLIGQSFFDTLTYNARGVVGYDHFLQSHVGPPNTGLTSFSTGTGRADVWQEVMLFYLGRSRSCRTVSSISRSTRMTVRPAARGLRRRRRPRSLPLTRLYPEVSSELFNLNGINHKIVLEANYYNA